MIFSEQSESAVLVGSFNKEKDIIGSFSEYCENYRELSLTAPVYEYHFPRAVQTPTIVIGFKTVKISQRPHQPWDGFINEKGVAACK